MNSRNSIVGMLEIRQREPKQTRLFKGKLTLLRNEVSREILLSMSVQLVLLL
jgi:hypothetical protein